MSFIELLQKETVATINGLVGVAPAISLKEETALNPRSTIASPAAVIELDFSGAASGKGRVIIEPRLATALSDMMVGGSGESKEAIEPDDLDATKEIISQIFGALSSSLAAQNEIVKLSIKTERAEFVETDLIELGRFAKSYSFNFTINAIESDLILALDREIAQAIENEAPKESAKIAAPSAPSAKEHLSAALTPEEHKNIQLLMDVRLTVRARIGRKQMLLRDVINMDIGSIVELDQLANEPLDILVDNKKIAEGEVVIVDGNFGIQITTIGTKKERLEQLKS
ncbi:MAG: flagellar motor switch protein FliY [Helicobacteraceae bacterium]|jgi:flagellar motor switch protein FliN/FliY|nr:flagellar motor switch protein FliY [Helicobacteraceae bacterium]